MTVHVSVIIVDFNAGEKLRVCLKHLEKQTYQDFDIVLLNNGNERYLVSDFNTFKDRLNIINPGSNLGFAAGNNLAVQQAKGEWVALLNPDGYPEPDWLKNLIQATQDNPAVKAFGSTQIMAADSSRLDGAGDVYHILGIPYRGYFDWPLDNLPKQENVFAACAAAALYETATFRSLGGFDDRFFCYGEDVDLGFRHLLSGGKTKQVHDAVIRHEGSGLSGRHSEFTIYHGHRNRIWLAYKNTPFWLYWPFLPLHFLANFYLLLRSPFAGVSRPYTKGLIDGYFGLKRFKNDRKAIQSKRKVSYNNLIKSIVWSPIKLSKRKGHNW